MRKAFLLATFQLVLSTQSIGAADALTEQQWLTKLQKTEQSSGKQKQEYGEMLFAVGNFYHSRKNYSQEQVMYDRAMKVFEKAPGVNGGLLRFYSDALGRVYLEEGKLERSETNFKRALKLAESIPEAEKVNVIPHTLGGIAKTYIAQGKFDQAESALKRRLEMRRRFIKAGQVDIAKVDLANLYMSWGKYPEAKAVIDELLTMQSPPPPVKEAVASYLAAVSKSPGR